MMDDGRQSWGVSGCLFGAVALFVILLVALFVIGIYRFSEPPAGPPGAPVHRPASQAVPVDGDPALALVAGRGTLPGPAFE